MLAKLALCVSMVNKLTAFLERIAMEPVRINVALILVVYSSRGLNRQRRLHSILLTSKRLFRFALCRVFRSVSFGCW